MRNHKCAFAKYCPNYDNDTCQSCYRVGDDDSNIVERAKKLLNNYFGRKTTMKLPEIKKVIFNEPTTIVLWADGTKTIVKCQKGDTYSKETGLAVAICKKALGNKGNFNEVFKKWIPEYGKDDH